MIPRRDPRGCDDVAPDIAAAIADAANAVFEYDDAHAWISARAAPTFTEPLAVEVWVFDRDFEHVVLVEHRWRGSVPPGGAAERAEHPRPAARRELFEETGLRVALEPRPATVAVRSYHPDWSPTLGLSYAAISDSRAGLIGEPDQAPRWQPLDRPWESVFADDRERILRYAAWAIHT